jgi:glycosyltransferase involved in cell wall biosynthesis
VVIIPNWADGADVIPTKKEQNPLLGDLGIHDRFVVQYSGNLGRFHELETVLQCAEILRGESFHFLFIGSGAREGLVKQHIDRGKAGNMQLLPYQPRSRLKVSLTACDVGLVTLRAGMAGLAVPSKLYGILAAGKPVVVIGPEDSEPAMVVRENHCGIVVRPGDPKGLANALRRLKDDGKLRADMGRNGRKAFEGLYDLPIVLAQWKELLKDVIENGNGKRHVASTGPSVQEFTGADDV